MKMKKLSIQVETVQTAFPFYNWLCDPQPDEPGPIWA
jgi:hypothetical protein